ncbi:hypothetical protein RBB80_05515 [Tunturiibacter gelidiferens]
MRRVDSNNSADDGVIENTFEKIAKLSGCGFEAIVAFLEYEPLHILRCDISQCPGSERGVNFFFKIAAKLLSVLSISLDYLSEVTLTEVGDGGRVR